MTEPRNSYFWPVVFGLSVGALIFSGFGGLVEGKAHVLFGAGAVFCLMMLIVPAIFAGTNQSLTVESGIAAIGGVLLGICGHLYFVADGRLSGMAGHAVLGGVGGYMAYWGSLLRYGGLFRGD